MTLPPAQGQGKLYFVTGGCRSGKSEFAQTLAEQLGAKRLFIATAYAADDEMRQRITRHTAMRGPSWHTHEVAKGHAANLADCLPNVLNNCEVALLDCLTLWAAACIEEGIETTQAAHCTDYLMLALRRFNGPVVVVSNEVGMGVVPAHRETRIFRDFAGIANQRAASAADAVVFVVSGIPMMLKGSVPL